jgi:hypothetical protein
LREAHALGRLCFRAGCFTPDISVTERISRSASGGFRRRSIHQTGLAFLIASSLLTGTTTASAAPPTTHVYVLLGGIVGRDGYLDSNWMLVLAGRIAQIPHTVVESYIWADWVSAANSIWALPSKNTKVVVVGYSGGGSRATWLANSILHKTIDLIVTYDPSPGWQMLNLPPNVNMAITFQNQTPHFFGLGGGVLTGPNVERFLIAEEHLAVQFDERLHQITLQAIEKLAR